MCSPNHLLGDKKNMQFYAGDEQSWVESDVKSGAYFEWKAHKFNK